MTASAVTWPASGFKSYITIVLLLQEFFPPCLNLASSRQLAEFLCSTANQAAHGAALLTRLHMEQLRTQSTLYAVWYLVFLLDNLRENKRPRGVIYSVQKQHVTTNMQTPLLNTKKESTIPKKEIACSFEIERNAADEYILSYSTRW